MKLTRPQWTRALDWPSVLMLALAVLIIVGAIWFVFIRPGQVARDAAEARGGEIVARGDLSATEKAGKALDDLRTETDDLKDLSRNNADDILKAKGAGDPVAAGVHDAQLRAQCLHHEYRNDPVCVRLRAAGSGKPKG
jgi:hypothetical protein